MKDRHEAVAKENESWQTNRKTAPATNVHVATRSKPRKKNRCDQGCVSNCDTARDKFQQWTSTSGWRRASLLVVAIGRERSHFSTLKSPKVCFPPTLHFTLTSHRTHFWPAQTVNCCTNAPSPSSRRRPDLLPFHLANKQ